MTRIHSAALPAAPTEDRLLVALASRGSLRLGQLLENVFGVCGATARTMPYGCLALMPDDELVSSIEAWVAEHGE